MPKTRSDRLITDLASRLQELNVYPANASQAKLLLDENSKALAEWTEFVVEHAKQLGLRPLLKQLARTDEARGSAVREALRRLSNQALTPRSADELISA